MDGSSILIVRDRDRPRKTIDQTMEKVLDLNGLCLGMTYNRIL